MVAILVASPAGGAPRPGPGKGRPREPHHRGCPMPTRLLLNPHPIRTLDDAASRADVLAFHQRLPGYAPTPLVDAPTLAAQLGVGRVWVKNESSRLGLPAFKMLGASWATYRALAARLGRSLEPWSTVDEL